MTTHDQHADIAPTRSAPADPSVETAPNQSPAGYDQPMTTASEPSTAQPDRLNEGAETSTDKVLFVDVELSALRSRWDDVQAAFVDDPRDCVQKADALVSDVVEQLTTGFTEARSRLEAQWARGEEASTEDLRIALKRYREFFERLLAV